MSNDPFLVATCREPSPRHDWVNVCSRTVHATERVLGVVDEQALVRAFEHYARILLSPYDMTHVLHELTDQVVDVLGIGGAGVCVANDDGRLLFVAATDGNVAVIEEQQVVRQQGPCHQAYRTGESVLVPDLAADQRWPAYREVALDRGCLAVAGLPMPVHERRIGALNLYCGDVHAWDDRELQVAQLLANMASGYILNHAELGSSRALTRQLRKALDSRIIVEQAKGVLSGRNDIPPNEAFELLRTHARTTSTRLHDVCEHVVEGRLRL